jgi:3-methyladenine DNA glycosylase AlkC
MKTGKKPKTLVQHEQATYHISMVEMLGKEGCEARVLFALALLSLQSDQPNPYPAFLQALNIKKRELTADKVAHAMWLNDPDLDQLKVSKLSFSMWAKTTTLAFDIQDVEKCLGTRYSIH